MKLLAALMAWLLLVPICSGVCDALILMQPGVAALNRPLPASPPLWVLWPPEWSRQGHSALLSLVTGQDWLGSNLDAEFTTIPDGRLRAENGRDLARRGIFLARSQVLGNVPTYVLAGAQKSLRETALLVGVEGPEEPVRVVEMKGAWPSSGLLVHEATSWADAENVIRRARRSIVIEYPAPVDRPWTRMWLRGVGWPSGLPDLSNDPAAGLIYARSVPDLLSDRFPKSWISGGEPSPEIPQRLAMIHSAAPRWRTCFGAILAGLLTVGLVLVLRERESRLLPELLQAAMLVPASAVLGAIPALPWGPPATVGVSVFGLYVLSKAGQAAFARWAPEAHPLVAAAILSWLVLTVVNPLWSPLSGLFAIEGPLPAGALGCWFGSMVASCAMIRGSTLVGEWLIRMAMLGVAALSLVARFWWAPSPFPFVFLPPLALVFAEGLWRLSFAPAVPLLGAFTTPGILYGIAWKPNNLLGRLSDAPKLNGSEFVLFLVSPLFLGTLAIVYLFSLLADRFLLHQYRHLVADDPRRPAVFSASAGLALLGVTQPSLLPAALWCAIAGLTILVHDALQVL